MAQYFLAWEKSAAADLSALLARDGHGAQAVIDLALHVAEDPAAAGAVATDHPDYHSAQRGNWFILFAVDPRFDRLTVVHFGTTI